MPNRLDNNPKYFCFCRNVHVKELALGLAWFRIIIAAILILFSLYQKLFSSNEIELSLSGKNKGSDQQLLIKGNVLYLDGLIFEGVFILVISALVVYADRKKKPWAYLPQLILDGFRLIGIIFGAIILAFLGVWLRQNESHINQMLKDLERDNLNEKPFEKHHYSLGGQSQNEKASEMPSFSSLLTVPVLILIAFGMILNIFTWVVTFRAYQYMRELTSTARVENLEEYRVVNDKSDPPPYTCKE